MDKKSLVSNYRTKLMKKLDRSNEMADNTTALEKTLSNSPNKVKRAYTTDQSAELFRKQGDHIIKTVD